ncbi:COG4-domain-containing protein [Clavulina sp. PMI_390]|nr:COG4-domain-containing protein [Clavulina sp. PMI_390]
MDLKTSLSALQAAIETGDWEAATRHCSRAMAVPEDIISGPFAESTVPTAESHLPPQETLANARLKLLDVFRQQFDKAAISRDSAGITRFFKLFPAAGWEKEGLEAYSDFVIDLVRSRPQTSGKISSPMHFVTALTSLFESIAMIVSQHQPVVEKYYGAGKMYPVIKRLLQECDRVVNSLIAAWEDERQTKRKLQDVVASPPTYIHQPAGPGRKQTAPIEPDLVDPRDIDQFLTELAGMAGRWSLFRRFLYDRLREDALAETPPAVDDPSTNLGAAPPQPETDSTLPTLSPTEIAALLEESTSKQLFATLIKTYYIPLEIWYLRTIIFKSHRLSTLDTASQPPQHTAPDDVFYILKAVLSRACSVGEVECLTKMCALSKDAIERDYAGVIKAKLEDVYSSRTGAPPARSLAGEKAERENRTTFMILLNDLSISSSHTELLVRGLTSSGLLENSFLDSELPSAATAIETIAVATTTFKNLVQGGIEQLFNQLTRPKLRQFVVDVYKDVSYKLDQDAYAAAEYNDIVRKRFIKLWSALLDGFKETFTDSNYHAFFLITVEILTRLWEKQILAMRFSELGAIRFDRDLRAVSSFLGNQLEFGDTREKFQRLQQISTLLNLDEEEDPEEFYSGSGIVWRLSANDAKTIVSLRT